MCSSKCGSRRKRFSVLSRIRGTSLNFMWLAISASTCSISVAEKRSRLRDDVRDLDALLHVAVEADAFGDAERRGLADIVQQRAQRQRGRSDARRSSSSSSVCVQTSPSG